MRKICFKRKRVISKDDWTTQSLGGKGGQTVAIDFCIHPDLALKKGAAHIFRKGGPDAAVKKNHQKRKIQNIMMT